VTLVIEGRDLDGDPELVGPLEPPARLVTDRPDLEPTSRRIAFRLAVRPDESAALVPLRVRTRTGITEPFLFRLGPLPEVEEVELEPPTRTPQRLELPVAVSGRLGTADVDSFRFVVQRGERLTIEAEARRLGSAVDPTLRLLDAGGRELALGEDAEGLDVDCRLDHTFLEAGEHVLEVRDAAYLERSPSFYRLRIGSFAFADAVFPPGGRRGEELEVELAGGNLADPCRVLVRLDPAPAGPWTWVSLPPELDRGGAFPLRLAVGDRPESREGQRAGPDAALPLSPGTVLNGRLAAPGEVDSYDLALSPGTRFTARLEAASFGSWLDGIIEVARLDGTRIAAADDDGPSADPWLSFAAPEGDGRTRIRVRDLLGRGGAAYGYRLLVEPERPEVRLGLSSSAVVVPAGGTAALAVDCARRSGAGAVRLRARGAPAGIDARCGEIPADATRGWITLTAAPDLSPQGFELVVEGVLEGDASREACRALATVHLASDQGAPLCPWATGVLAGAIAAPALIEIACRAETVDLVPGTPAELPVEVRRRGGAAGEATLSVAAIPGVTAEEVKVAIGAGATVTARLSLVAAPKAAGREGDLLVAAACKVGDGELSAAAPLCRVRVAPPFTVELAACRWEVQPGGTVPVRGEVRRSAPFSGAVRIELEGLPEGMKVSPVEVAPGQTGFELAVAFPPDAGGGAVAASIVASCRLGQGKESAPHRRPPLPVVFDIAPGSRSGAAQR
jgi:hypothetical protein